MLLRYVGDSSVNFIKSQIYEANRINDANYGKCYVIDDEDDWNIYLTQFVEENFEIVEEDE